ncbi:hypothetical protein [Coraliomargarita akajimensis]|uniref:Uncharacterized protein n=1 Tax=Coraliomargarita akajimensis (strain DSM 45221 / IAM 15411 / JCM 23193 / KCTC 12865 / 04OKA010-24) TaxID=583355 RepID=D5EMA0_CORAD|nr:hypothetical protein [Coraliomargarita akajimensis]ADE55260.1 hypothetical protein Caka_2243 [Coraliomargarita akajimensis DSM 45221]
MTILSPRPATMIRFYYRWRYRRAQRAGAFRLPSQNASNRSNFGSYLSQHSVRGRTQSSYDSLQCRKRWILRIVLLTTVIGLGWLAYESFEAIRSWND